MTSGELTSTAAVSITVTGVNDDPEGEDDEEATDQNSIVAFNVLDNDTDVDDGDVLSVLSIDNSTLLGFVVVNPDGSSTYDPGEAFIPLAVGEEAEETFSYVVQDSFGATDTATVTITIEGLNDDPVAVGDSAGTDERSSVDVDVLANDSDVDGDDLIVVGVNPVQIGGDPTIGSVSFDEDGVTYDSNGGFQFLGVGEQGTDSFGYQIDDSNGGSAVAGVEITIEGVNDDPEAEDDVAETDEKSRRRHLRARQRQRSRCQRRPDDHRGQQRGRGRGDDQR